jgi:hypothetical protein
MKTIYNVLTSLSLSILCVNGQTTDNFSVIPSTSSKKIFISLGKTTVTKASYAELTLEQLLQANNIQLGKTQNETLKLAKLYLQNLQQQADELLSKETALRLQAKTKQNEERRNCLQQAKELAMQAEIKLIHASEILGKINRYHYTSNKNNYNQLSLANRADADVTMKAESIYFDAEHTMHMSSEMREEAYAQPNNSTKLGTLGNAEEGETIALLKQTEAINILKQANQ